MCSYFVEYVCFPIFLHISFVCKDEHIEAQNSLVIGPRFYTAKWQSQDSNPDLSNTGGARGMMRLACTWS